MSTSLETKSPATVILELVDELLEAGIHPSERSLAAVRNQLGVLDQDERSRLFQTILTRVPEHHEDEMRWKALAAIVLCLPKDSRLKCSQKNAFVLAEQMFAQHKSEPGIGKAVVLALRDLRFYWER